MMKICFCKCSEANPRKGGREEKRPRNIRIIGRKEILVWS
jgi:hypothetical protein